MEGVNAERLTMIAKTPASRYQPASTKPLAQQKTANPNVMKTASNTIPLGAPRRGPPISDVAQHSSHLSADVSPPEDIMSGAPAVPENTTPYTEVMESDGRVDNEMEEDDKDEDDTVFILEEPVARGVELTSHNNKQHLAIDSYLQPSEPFSDFGTKDLWLLPTEDPNFVLRTRRVTDPFRIFQSQCRKIRQNWGCAPWQCLPPELRRTTPYSLVMLQKLALLSTATPSGCRGVQELLFAQAAGRVARLPMPAHDSPGLRIVRSPGQKNVEERILENVEGLMLGDVDRVSWQLKTGSVEGIHLAPDLSGEARSTIQAAMTLKARKEDKKAARETLRKQRDDFERQARGRPLSRKERKVQRRNAKQKEKRLKHQNATAQSQDAEQVDPLRYPLRSRQDDALVQQLTKLGVNRASPAEAHRKDRRTRHKATMQHGLPSERLQHASMPSLHLLAEAREVNEGMSKLGLHLQQPLPPPILKQPAIDTDEEEGGVSLVGHGGMPTAQDNVQFVDMHSYPAGASHDGLALSMGSHRLPAARCPECFNLHRKCTHTEYLNGAGEEDGYNKTSV